MVFRKGKGSSKFLRAVDDKFVNFLPFHVRDAGIQAVASVAATSGFHNVFVCGCAAAALASAFAYLFTLVVGISAAAACVYECTLVLEGTSVLLRLLTFGVNVSAAAAFSVLDTLVLKSTFVSVAVFCVASATAAALVRLLCILLELMPLWTWGVLGLRLLFPEARRLGADKVLLLVSGSFWRFAALNVSDLDVIRRVLAKRAGVACDGVSGVAGINDDHGVDMSVIALPRIKGMQSFRVDAGTRPHIALMAKAEATPRVDVGEVSTTTMVSRGSAKTNQSVTRSLLGWTGRHLSFKSGKICRFACSDCLSSSCFT